MPLSPETVGALTGEANGSAATLIGVGGVPKMSGSPGPGEPTLLDLARQEFPVLDAYDIAYAVNPTPNAGYLEFWPSDEPGSQQYPRPQSLPIGKIGLEVRDLNTRPIDIMADIASHHLITADPNVSAAYSQFRSSLTPQQRAMLQEQYQYAQQNFGERRPFEQWLEHTGLPSMFRGYAFQQWPQDFNQKVYTPEQMKAFDRMMLYLRGKSK